MTCATEPADMADPADPARPAGRTDPGDVADPTGAAGPADPFVGLEVATVAADTLRASVRITGQLQAATAPLLSSVLRTHLTAGRRFLRVDLEDAVIADPAVVDALVQVHVAVTGLGGMLIFENAAPAVVEAVRSASLYVTSAET